MKRLFIAVICINHVTIDVDANRLGQAVANVVSRTTGVKPLVALCHFGKLQ